MDTSFLSLPASPGCLCGRVWAPTHTHSHTHTRGSSPALLRLRHSMLPSAGSPIPKPPEPDPLCCPVKVGHGVHSLKGCRLLSGWASSPSLWPPWMAHLCPLNQGQPYSAVQTRCRDHSPVCCSWQGAGPAPQLSRPRVSSPDCCR